MDDQSLCSVCRARVRAETTTYTQQIDGRIAVVTDVPVLTCPQCGEQYFTPDTVDRLQQLMTGAESGGEAPRTIEVPVYAFSRAS
jgi:YgiT-type zinc finger domain-containing protein